MKALLVLALFAAALAPRPAHAFSACNNNDGFAPRKGVVLPKHARLLAFGDRKSRADWKYSATLAGKPVPLKVTKMSVAPYYMTQLEVDSDNIGTLVIYQGDKQTTASEVARYEVKANAGLPKEVAGTPRRFTRNIQHSTVKELYDVLAIDFDDATPAILATIKIRRDAAGAWSTFDVPVNTGDFMDTRTSVRIGALGCTSNYTVGLLEQGVDLELTVTLADGSKRPVKLPAQHVTLPKKPTDYLPPRTP